MKKLLLSIYTLLCCALIANAQFDVTGTESSAVLWNTFKTPHYEFIYPIGCDSIAYRYAYEWERAHILVGMEGKMQTKKRMSVVLHPYTTVSNGFVAWTPSRMEMYLAPEMYDPDPLPWERLLALHENRHVEQMQPLRKDWWWILRILTGELYLGPASTIFSSAMFMEGDAVATETALSPAGRGRTADFLEYMRVCFENGDLRNYDRWRFGSQRLFTPDYYKVGYLAVAGAGAHEKSEAYGFSFRTKFKFASMRLQEQWCENTASRAPFQDYTLITDSTKYFTSYSGLCNMEDEIYAIRSAMDDNTRIVRIDPKTGIQTSVALTSADSRLATDKEKLYWTENMPDIRWEMHSTSELRFLDGKKPKSKIIGAKVYNPAIEGNRLALIRNLSHGGCEAVVFSMDSLKLQSTFTAPDGLQFVEPAFVDSTLYVSGLSLAGEGIYKISEEGLEEVLTADHLKINHLFGHDGMLYFTSDRSGVNELYRLNGTSVEQCTNLPQGGKDFTFAGDSLYFTVLSPEGRNIAVTPCNELPVRQIDFSEKYSYPLVDKLVEHRTGLMDQEALDALDSLQLPEPKRYYKSLHALRFHSWVPFLYLSADDILSSSMETLYFGAGLGATVYTQNNLGTLYGEIGAKLWGIDSGWDPSLSFKIAYRGLYPVIETSGQINLQGSGNIRLRTYIPLNFSSDGWSRGIIPVASATYINNPSAGLQGYLLSAGVRAYSVLNKPQSCIFPRWGIGGEIGTMNKFPYISLYGYVPGFAKTHGWAFNAEYIYGISASASIRYGLPLFSLDYNGLSPFTYIRNVEMVPFYSYNYTDMLDEHRIGTQIYMVLGNLSFITYNIHLGVEASYGNVGGFSAKLIFNYEL